MPKFMTLGIELPDDAEYPPIKFGSEQLGGRLVSASTINLFDRSDETEAKLEQVADIAIEALKSFRYDDIQRAIGAIQALVGDDDASH